MSQHVTDERPQLVRLLAITAMAGCLILIGGTLAAQSMVPDHDWMAETISDLGAGRLEIIMDVALYGFAAGLFASALATSNVHMGGWGWSIGLMSLASAAALVVVVGARNEYGDGDNEGVVIHTYLVYGLGLAFTLIPFCMANGAGRILSWARPALIALGALWVIASPIFFFLPTDIDGLYERGLGLISIGMVVVLAIVLLKRAKELT